MNGAPKCQYLWAGSITAPTGFPVFEGDAVEDEEGVAGADVVAEAVHAADLVEVFGLDVGAGGIDEAIFGVDTDDKAEDDAGARADFNDGVEPALKSGVRLGDAGDFDGLRWSSGEACGFKFVDSAGKVDGAEIHLNGQIFRDDVDDEFFSFGDVERGVFGDRVLAGAAGDAEADDGRIGGEVVISAEGRGVEGALGIHAGDKGDGARSDKSDEELVGDGVRKGFEVEIHGKSPGVEVLGAVFRSYQEGL